MLEEETTGADGPTERLPTMAIFLFLGPGIYIEALARVLILSSPRLPFSPKTLPCRVATIECLVMVKDERGEFDRCESKSRRDACKWLVAKHVKSGGIDSYGSRRARAVLDHSSDCGRGWQRGAKRLGREPRKAIRRCGTSVSWLGGPNAARQSVPTYLTYYLR